MQNEVARDVLSFYLSGLFGFGVIVLLVAWLPLILKRMPLSLPIICVFLGMVLFAWTPFADYTPHPLETPVIIEKATELIVIISLMGAGLKIGRPFSMAGWRIPVRLLGIAMPLTILGLGMIGYTLLGLSIAAALLLAACLAPTDPVLAADVQIDGPETPDTDETRFALTAEAGLNDALGFPFIHLAIAVSVSGFSFGVWSEWLLRDILLSCAIGIAIGVASGVALGKIIYRLPSKTKLSRTGDGFVALGATLVVYSLTEFAHGYGFLGVFLAGFYLRREAEGHQFNQRLHDFADETERLLMMILLVFFGGMISAGGLLAGVRWQEFLFVLVALLIVRPVVGWCSITGIDRMPMEKLIISFFGIRGLGSVYYLAFALNHGNFGEAGELWRIVALVIFASILLHGIAVTPMMRKLELQCRGDN